MNKLANKKVVKMRNLKMSKIRKINLKMEMMLKRISNKNSMN